MRSGSGDAVEKNSVKEKFSSSTEHIVWIRAWSECGCVVIHGECLTFRPHVRNSEMTGEPM